MTVRRIFPAVVGLALLTGGLTACGDDGPRTVDIAAIPVAAEKVASVTYTAAGRSASFTTRDGVFLPGPGATGESATLLNASSTAFPVNAYRTMTEVDLATPDYGLVSTGTGRASECGSGCGMTVTAADGATYRLRVGARTFNSAGFYAAVDGDPRVFLLISATVAQIISLATGRPFSFPPTQQELDLQARQDRLAEEAQGRGDPSRNYDPFLRQVLAAEQDRKAARDGKPTGALVRAATSTQDQPGGENPSGEQAEGANQ